MTPESWRQIEELYQAALDLPSAERRVLLEKAEPQVRSKVETLLTQEGSAVDRPAWEGRTGLLAATETIIASGTQLGLYRN